MIILDKDAVTSPKHGCSPEDRSIEQLLESCFILLDKSPGPSSHQISAWARDMMGLDKLGHGGTLDPFASGLLPLLSGKAMRLTGTESGVEITTIADIPGRGTGLGSSSSVTVGLLHAMHAFHGRKISKEQLAEEACKIEIEILGAPIGRQDQYACAFGGINSISFGSNGVMVEPIDVSDELITEISKRFSLVFTGLTRSANKVLSQVVEDIESKNSSLKEIREHADLAAGMMESGDLDSLGRLLNSSWLAKRETSPNVSNDVIDKLYNQLISSGAKGAKLLGAGSGGFFLVYGEDSLRQQLTNKLDEEKRIIPVGIDFSGSQIIYG